MFGHPCGFSHQGSRPARRGLRYAVVRWLSGDPHLFCSPPSVSLGSHVCFPPALQLSLYLLSPDPGLPAWLPCLTLEQPSCYRLAGDTRTPSCPPHPCPTRIPQGYVLAGDGLVQSTWLRCSALSVSFMNLAGCSSKYFFQTFFFYF